LSVEDDVFRLNVAVHYQFGVQIVKRHEDGGDHELGFSLREDCQLGEVISEVSAFHEVHEDVEVVVVLEGVEHVHNELMPQRGEELAFVEDGVDTALGDDAGSKQEYMALDISFIA
jgi:hypothetical protein